MFDQFPAMKKVFEEPKYFAEDVSKIIIKVGADPHAAGTAGGDVVAITPYIGPDDFTKAWLKSKNLRLFIEDTLAGSKSTWAHEFDHWLRKLSQRRAGINVRKSFKYDDGLWKPDGSIDSKKWHSKFSEFEAEFTAGQMRLLDKLLRYGMTDELATILKNPKAFERQFLQSYPTRTWQGPVGKGALKRIRKRLFDTERGLYYSLRRALGISSPKKKLPESALRELIQQIIKEA